MKDALTTIRKVFPNLPFAHRQHLHKGHCALIHGHNWTFALTFACRQLDANGFVVDFGKLKLVREWLEAYFDHTLVLNEDDPMLDYLKTMLGGPVQCKGEDISMAKIVVVPNCGAEGIASWLLEKLNNPDLLPDFTERGVRVVKVEAFEDAKNSATVEAL